MKTKLQIVHAYLAAEWPDYELREIYPFGRACIVVVRHKPTGDEVSIGSHGALIATCRAIEMLRGL